MSKPRPRVVLLGIDGMATQDLEAYVRQPVHAGA